MSNVRDALRRRAALGSGLLFGNLADCLRQTLRHAVDRNGKTARNTCDSRCDGSVEFFARRQRSDSLDLRSVVLDTVHDAAADLEVLVILSKGLQGLRSGSRIAIGEHEGVRAVEDVFHRRLPRASFTRVFL